MGMEPAKHDDAKPFGGLSLCMAWCCFAGSLFCMFYAQIAWMDGDFRPGSLFMRLLLRAAGLTVSAGFGASLTLLLNPPTDRPLSSTIFFVVLAALSFFANVIAILFWLVWFVRI
jgi:hypothetical protein